MRDEKSNLLDNKVKIVLICCFGQEHLLNETVEKYERKSQNFEMIKEKYENKK